MTYRGRDMENNQISCTETHDCTKSYGKENAEYKNKGQNQKFWNKETNQSERCHVESQRGQVEMGRSLDKEGRQQMDKEAHRMVPT